MSPRTPRLDSLRVFEVAGRLLNFRQAADELHLTQSAVAQRVRALEADLGVTLFYREARGLATTPAGLRYHGAISSALAIIEEATRNLSAASERLRISVPPSFAAKWLVPRLPDFRRRYPALDLQVDASEKRANFRSDGIDFAVRQGRPPFGDGLQHELLSHLYLCAVCSPGYANEVDALTDAVDWDRYRLISDAHDHWDHLVRPAHRLAVATPLRFSHTSLAIDAAKGGQGITIAPRLFVAEDIAAGQLVSLHGFPNDERGFYLVFPETRAAEAHATVIPWFFAQIEEAADAGRP